MAVGCHVRLVCHVPLDRFARVLRACKPDYSTFAYALSPVVLMERRSTHRFLASAAHHDSLEAADRQAAGRRPNKTAVADQ